MFALNSALLQNYQCIYSHSIRSSIKVRNNIDLLLIKKRAGLLEKFGYQLWIISIRRTWGRFKVNFPTTKIETTTEVRRPECRGLLRQRTVFQLTERQISNQVVPPTDVFFFSKFELSMCADGSGTNGFVPCVFISVFNFKLRTKHQAWWVLRSVVKLKEDTSYVRCYSWNCKDSNHLNVN